MGSVLLKVTLTETAVMLLFDVELVKGRMRLLIKGVLSINAVFNLPVYIMSKSLKILQLNAQKSPMVQLILLNDQDLASYGILILSEPHAWRIDVKVIVTPMSHSYWQPFLPSIINPEGYCH